MSWLITIALVAFLQGVGKFLDDYYVAPRTRDRVRDFLIRAFLVLDTLAIPDIPKQVMIWTLRPGTRWTLQYVIWRTVITLITAACIGAVLVLTWFDSYLEYDLDIILYGLAATVVVISLLSNLIFVLTRYIFNKIYNRVGDATSIMLSAVIPMMIILVMVSIIWGFLAILAFLLLNLGLFGIGLGLLLLMLFAEPTIVVLLGVFTPFVVMSASIVLIFCVKVIIETMRWILMKIFDAASSPTVSPFGYLCALLGVGILGIKLLIEL